MRFGPGAAGAALGVAAHELRDRTVALEDVWGAPARASWPSAWPARRAASRLALLAAAVARRLDGARAPDPLVTRASALLARGVPVTAASREVALTDRHLRRRFHDAVGYGPKTLQRVLRLRRFLALAEAGPSADLARAAAEAGYADQPHLTRECAELAGLPPAALLAARAAPDGARPGRALEERLGQPRQQRLGDAQRLADLDVLHVVVLVAGGRGRRQGGQARAALEERALDVPADDALGRQRRSAAHERSFFQRRAGLATLVATTAAGDQHYDVQDLELGEVLRVADALVPGWL